MIVHYYFQTINAYIIFGMFMNSSSKDEVSFEIDKEPREQANQLYVKEKEKRVELAHEVNQAKREIKRLKQVIDKMSHQQKNAILYFETTIKELEETNQEYKARLDGYENMNLKCKKTTNLSHSKLNRSTFNHSMQQSVIKNASENKENINFLNASQNSTCTSPFCQAREELHEINALTASIIASLHNLGHCIEGKKQWSNEEHEEWLRMLEQERNKRRSDGNKSSLQLVRAMQEKIDSIAESLQNQPERADLTSQPLFDYFRSLTQKQKNLMKTPFLQKIDLKQRKADTNLFLESAQLLKQRMLDLMQQ